MHTNVHELYPQANHGPSQEAYPDEPLSPAWALVTILAMNVAVWCVIGAVVHWANR